MGRSGLLYWISGVSKTYRRGEVEVRALRDVNLDVAHQVRFRRNHRRQTTGAAPEARRRFAEPRPEDFIAA